MKEVIPLPEDDAFLKSILHFGECINNIKARLDNYDEILKQAEIVHQFKELAKIDL